jgi:hypothetical protein
MVPGVRWGHNGENHFYMCLFFFEIFSPEPAGQFQSNLVQIILRLKEFRIVQIKGQVFFKGEIITKIRSVHLKILSITNKPPIYMKAS